MIILGQEIYNRMVLIPRKERTVHEETGLTYGASFAGYDIRIKQDVMLDPGEFKLASSYERFVVPPDLIGFVCDKSSLARMGLFVGVGVIEPGWQGWLTLELKNQGNDQLFVMAGQPIAQIVFHRLDVNVLGYAGRYQDQPDEPTEAKITLMYRLRQHMKREKDEPAKG
jgi:dCTP deaminase